MRITFVFYAYLLRFLLSDGSSGIGFESFLENVKCFPHFIHFKYVCNAGVVQSLARSLVE